MTVIPKKYQTRKQRDYSESTGSDDIGYRYMTRAQRAHYGYGKGNRYKAMPGTGIDIDNPAHWESPEAFARYRKRNPI